MKSDWKTELKDLVEMWIRPENRKLTVFWCACLIGVLALGFYTHNRTSSFLGIADSRETIINFEFPVTVKRVHFLPGQAVKKGDLLIELDQPDLDMRIHAVRAQIEKLQAERGLKREMGRLASSAAQAQIEDAGYDPLTADIKNFERELRALEGRERNLFVFAEISGVVGSINFKRGERAQAYAPILTISPTSPTHVQGFIHETLHSQVKIGQKMEVVSIADPSKKFEGRVVSIGSRIVELPPRMARLGVSVWGREVSIELNKNETIAASSLLLGEKVQIHPPFELISVAIAQASDKLEKERLAPVALVEPQPIAVPEVLKDRLKFEPSGLIYLPDLRKYAVVSDDTDDDDTPYIFLMNSDGTIETRALRINGLDKIADVESISTDDKGQIYVLSSQGENSSGKAQASRSKLVQVRRDGASLIAVKSMILRPSLIAAVKASTAPELQSIKNKIEDELDVEASMIRDGQLIIAFKQPLDDKGRSFLLSLGSVEKILAAGKISPKDLSVWKTIAFGAPSQGTGKKNKKRITDVVAIDDHRLLISTTSKDHGKVGAVWMIDGKSSAPTLVHEFPSYSPEGLAYDAAAGELMIVFDEGSDDAHFAKIKIPGSK